jgi:hypothetical protein
MTLTRTAVDATRGPFSAFDVCSVPIGMEAQVRRTADRGRHQAKLEEKIVARLPDTPPSRVGRLAEPYRR